MKALCLVAHPDDCVIFGYSYIHHHPEHEWTVGYLTYTADDARGAELQQFWQRRGIGCVFLGFEDDWHDQEQQQFNCWPPMEARAKCSTLAAGYDIVLTHDANGDYGHIHHQLVHQAVCDHPGLVTFAPPGQGTVTLALPPDTYSIQELPMHGNIVQGFHPREHQNSYKEQA